MHIVFAQDQSAHIWLDIWVSPLFHTELSKLTSNYSLIHLYIKGVYQVKCGLWYFWGSNEAPLTISAEQQRMVNVFGHIMLKAPVLVWSLKLSSIEPCEYLDGWPPGNTRCWRQFCFGGWGCSLGLSTHGMEESTSWLSKLDQAI